ncbi:uncharacterized protein PODANS_2_2340, partial [Podospora anserina S mat+]
PTYHLLIKRRYHYPPNNTRDTTYYLSTPPLTILNHADPSNPQNKLQIPHHPPHLYVFPPHPILSPFPVTDPPCVVCAVKEAQELTNHPSPFFLASPLETDLFEWHFTLLGPPSSPYENGLYHGRINLPPSYPLRPPSFRFLTPSGRFEVNREICLSISGHHEETWQPAWGIRTALVALRSFMETDVKGQLGGLEAGSEVRRRLAGESRGWVCGVG